MYASLDKLTIHGFKSIKELRDLQLKKLNVFVGANGCGKSNFISFFKMLHSLMDGNLFEYLRKNGGIGDILYNGRKTTQEMTFEMHFGERGYRFTLNPTLRESMALTDEAIYYQGHWRELGNSYDVFSLLVKEAKGGSSDAEFTKPVYDSIMSWVAYHFHDTGPRAPMRHSEITADHGALRPNASNIAPFLLHIRDNSADEYNEILNACRLALPFLKEFIFQEQLFGSANEKRKVNLSWRTKQSDYPWQTYHLSDGSIRFICLATALLQPNPPSTLIIDEPELGLHPEAIRLLGELIKSAAWRTQVIIATQSPLLLDQFGIEDIVVVNRQDDQSVFERLNQKDFDEWLEDYTTGELWAKNVIHGGSNYE